MPAMHVSPETPELIESTAVSDSPAEESSMLHRLSLQNPTEWTQAYPFFGSVFRRLFEFLFRRASRASPPRFKRLHPLQMKYRYCKFVRKVTVMSKWKPFANAWRILLWQTTVCETAHFNSSPAGACSASR